MQWVYTVVLIFSCALATAAFLRAHRQLAPVFHFNRTRVGGLIIMPALGFLVVVAAPGPVVSGALLLTALGWWDDHRGVDRNLGLVLTLLACSMGIDGLPTPVFHLIPIAIPVLVIWLGWWGLTFTAERLPHNLINCIFAMTLAFLPLAVAPLLGYAPNSLALDISMLASAMLGALLIANRQYEAALALRLPLVFLLGYAIWRVLIAGAWPFALLSLMMLAVMVFWRRPASHAGANVQNFG